MQVKKRGRRTDVRDRRGTETETEETQRQKRDRDRRETEERKEKIMYFTKSRESLNKY